MSVYGTAPQSLVVNTNANGALINGVNGTAYAVLGYTLSASASMGITFQTNTTAIAGPIRLATNATVACPPSSCPLFRTNAGEPLNINISAAGIVSGHITYVTL